MMSQRRHGQYTISNVARLWFGKNTDTGRTDLESIFDSKVDTAGMFSAASGIGPMQSALDQLPATLSDLYEPTGSDTGRFETLKRKSKCSCFI